MKISVNDGKACEKILSIELGEDSIRKEYDDFINAVTPKANIPGFRVGKAPRNVVMSHFHQEARQAVLKNLISDSLKNAIREKALEPLSYPEIVDVQFEEKKLAYKAKLEIRPKIKLAKVFGLSAKRNAIEVTPKEIEESINRVRESLAQYKAVEDRPSVMGDYLIADYVCLVDGKEVENRTDDWLELKEEEFLPGFSKQLAGAKAGDERTAQVTFPEKTGRKEMAGKSAVFQVKVKEIKAKILPELNDEFARAAGEYQTLDELKKKIELDVRLHKERDAEAQFEKSLIDELLKHNKVDLPEGMVARRFEHLVERSKHDLMGRGVPEEIFEKQKEQISKELQQEARREVHLAFLLDELASRENVTATADDLKLKYEDLSKYLRQPAADIEKYYSEHEDARESLCEQIRNAKAIELIKKNAKIK